MAKMAFKDKQLNANFDLLLKNPPYNEDGSKNKGSSLHDWFWKGFSGVPFHMVVKSSQIRLPGKPVKNTKKSIQPDNT